MPKRYSLELRTEVIAGYLVGKGVPDLAQEFDIPEETIWTWIKPRPNCAP